MTEDNARRILSASFVAIMAAAFSSIFPDTIPQLTSDKADLFFQENSIESVFPNRGLASDLVFVAISISPALSALLYAFNTKFAGHLFVFSFGLYLLSPFFFNINGAELYSALDIFLENLLSAVGGMLSCHVIISQSRKTTVGGD